MFAHVLTLQASQEWSELEETAGEGFKVVGRVREEMREKVKKELIVLKLEALYKQVHWNKYRTYI